MRPDRLKRPNRLSIVNATNGLRVFSRLAEVSASVHFRSQSASHNSLASGQMKGGTDGIGRVRHLTFLRGISHVHGLPLLTRDV